MNELRLKVNGFNRTLILMEVESQLKVESDYEFEKDIHVDVNEETILKALIKNAESGVNC
jgi:hypothetical protein